MNPNQVSQLEKGLEVAIKRYDEEWKRIDKLIERALQLMKYIVSVLAVLYGALASNFHCLGLSFPFITLYALMIAALFTLYFAFDIYNGFGKKRFKVGPASELLLAKSNSNNINYIDFNTWLIKAYANAYQLNLEISMKYYERLKTCYMSFIIIFLLGVINYFYLINKSLL